MIEGTKGPTKESQRKPAPVPVHALGISREVTGNYSHHSCWKKVPDHLSCACCTILLLIKSFLYRQNNLQETCLKICPKYLVKFWRHWNLSVLFTKRQKLWLTFLLFPEDGVGIFGSSRPISVSSRLEEAMLISSFVGGELHSCPPQHTLRHRPPHILPACDNGAEDMDNLDDVCMLHEMKNWK
jgi:hypothetical protein